MKRLYLLSNAIVLGLGIHTNFCFDQAMLTYVKINKKFTSEFTKKAISKTDLSGTNLTYVECKKLTFSLTTEAPAKK